MYIEFYVLADSGEKQDLKADYIHDIWKYWVDDITKGDCVEWEKAKTRGLEKARGGGKGRREERVKAKGNMSSRRKIKLVAEFKVFIGYLHLDF